MSDRIRRTYRRRTSSSTASGDRVSHHLSSRFQQFCQGFGLPFRSVGRPDIAIFQLAGLVVSIGLIYVIFDAVTYGLNAPSVRTQMPRTPAKAISYGATEWVIELKNDLVTGEARSALPVPDEYAEAATGAEEK